MSLSAIVAEVVPVTSAAPPIETSTMPLVLLVIETLPIAESWSSRLSRWSSRSFGCTPPTVAWRIELFSVAICAPSWFTFWIVAVTFCPVCPWIVVSWLESALKPLARLAADCARACLDAMFSGSFETACHEDQYCCIRLLSPLSAGSLSASCTLLRPSLVACAWPCTIDCPRYCRSRKLSRTRW